MARKIETIGRQLLQGGTLGFADEAIDIPTAAIVAALTGQKYTDVLKEARDLSKQRLAEDWEQSPYTSFAANMVGGVPFGLSAAAKNWASTGSRLARAGKGFATGAGLGAVAGFGAGDDTIEGRAVGAGLGATIGGILGGAGGSVSSGRPSVKAIANKTASKVGGNKAEKEFIRELLMRPDLDKMQKQAVLLEALSKKTGVDLTLPEMISQTDVDPFLGKQSILVKSPETAGQAQAILQKRMGDALTGQKGQIVEGLESLSSQLSPGSYDDLSQGLIKRGTAAAKGITSRLSSKAQPLYEAAYKKVVPEQELASLVSGGDGPILSNAIEAAFKDERFAGALQGKKINSIEVLDAAKRIIDEKIAAGKNPSAPFDTRAYEKAVSGLKNTIIKSAPEYGDALEVYSSRPDLLNKRKLVGDLGKIKELAPEKVVKELYSGTVGTATKTAEALGPRGSKMAAAAKVQDIIGGLKTGRLPPNMDADTINMMRAYAGPDAELVSEYLQVIDKARLGERYLRGSQTDALKNLGEGMRDASGAAVDVAVGNVPGLWRRAGQEAVNTLTKNQKEKYAQDLLNLYTTPRGMEVLNKATGMQQQLLKAPPTQIALPTASSSSRSLTAGFMAPDYRPTVAPTAAYSATPALTQSTISDLPEGYQIRQKQTNTLPEGYTIRRSQ